MSAVGGVLHGLWHDADDRVGSLVEFDGAAQDSRVAGKTLLPQSVTQYRH